jgi:two-component system response regulator RegX3
METLIRASADAADAARIVPYRTADARSAATILLVEVEPLLTDSIKYALERDGHRIVSAQTRKAGLSAMAVERPALVLVELDHAASEVAEFCRQARSLSAAPLILITPAISDADRADVLQAGADDLLTKPFSLREVAQRVGVQLRRERSAALSRELEDEILRMGPVEMDIATHEVRVRGNLTFFPPKEFALLETLMRSGGRLVKRDRLIWTVWGAGYFGDGKTLDTHVKRLRKKIETDPHHPLHLVVVRGMGYRFLDRENSV